MNWSVMRWSVLGLGLAALLAAPAEAREWKIYENEKYGYSLKIPAEFNLDSEDKTTNWTYQPGSAPSGSGEAKSKSKSRSFGVNVRGFGFRTSESESSSGIRVSSSGGGLEPALGIYVNWVWMPDVSDSGSPCTPPTRRATQQRHRLARSRLQGYRRLSTKTTGTTYEGNTYWFKEVDKSKGDEIHRWHIKSYGNKSAIHHRPYRHLRAIHRMGPRLRRGHQELEADSDEGIAGLTSNQSNRGSQHTGSRDSVLYVPSPQ